MTPAASEDSTSTTPVVRVRRAHAVVAYWQDGSLVLHNYLSGKQTSVSPAVLSLLDAFETPVDLRELMSVLDRARARGVVEKLIAQDVLVAEGSHIDLKDTAVARWKWQQDARFFHFSTQHVKYERSGASQAADLRARARQHPPPSPFKSVDGAEKISLSEDSSDVTCSLWDALAKRRTVRAFARAAISREQLGTILRWTWGATRVVNDIGTHVLKTSPAGGARHPV